MITDVFPGAIIRELVVSNTPYWTANNPSIAWSPVDGYRFVVRSSNFHLDESQCIHLSNDLDGVTRTRNFIGRMDDDLNVTELVEIDYSALDETIRYPGVLGTEDARIFWDYPGATWRLSGTHRQHSTSGVPTIAVDTLVSNRVIYRDVKLRSLEPEKNWMPTVPQHGYPAFLYGPWADDWRGSSQAVEVMDGEYRMGVLHKVTWPGRQFWHRLVLFDMSENIKLVTPPFYFREPGVEFANGLIEWQDQWVITFGFREQRALMAYIPNIELWRALD